MAATEYLRVVAEATWTVLNSLLAKKKCFSRTEMSASDGAEHRFAHVRLWALTNSEQIGGTLAAKGLKDIENKKHRSYQAGVTFVAFSICRAALSAARDR